MTPPIIPDLSRGRRSELCHLLGAGVMAMLYDLLHDVLYAASHASAAGLVKAAGIGGRELRVWRVLSGHGSRAGFSEWTRTGFTCIALPVFSQGTAGAQHGGSSKVEPCGLHPLALGEMCGVGR